MVQYIGRCLCLVCLLFLISGCSNPEREVEITDIRVVPAEERVAPPVMANKDRLGISTSPGGHPMMSLPEEEEEGLLTWTIPSSWNKAPGQSMRLVTLIPEGSHGSECYVSLLGGVAGGLDANINRWRNQIELPPLSEEEISALPRISVLDREAVLVEMEGLPSGQGGAETVPMVLGLVCPLDEATLFVKMTGPASELRGEKGHFLSFVSSLALREEGSS